MKIKKIFTAIIVGALSTSILSSTAFAITNEVNNTLNNTGVLVEDGSYLTSPIYLGSNKSALTRTVLPSQVDLSNSIYFPPIGDQGSLGSCAAFATTYYQYTYEVNKLNSITSEDEREVYSPSWPYSLLSNGNGGGITVTSTYEMLSNFGCLKLEDLPYNKDTTVNYPTDMELEKVEALSTRLSSYGTYDIAAEGTVITSNTDTDLNMVKSALSNGKVLVVTSPFSWDSKYGFGNYSDKLIYYRTKWSSIGHAMAVVGYNDNISCDVNNNGSIEACEKGAFKIANSWGDTNGDNGYIWVLYDALNKVSANTVGNWEASLEGMRHSAFEFSCEENAFFYINVAHKDVNFVGELSVNSSDRRNIRIGINRTSKNVYRATTYNSIYPFNMNSQNDSSNIVNSSEFNGIIVFDYSDLCVPISNYISGYNWHVKILDSENACQKSRFRILDNYCNVISDYESSSSSQATNMYKYKNINLSLGDANLDGVINLYDAILVSQYNMGSTLFSNVQAVVADINKDGVVNLYDVIEISDMIS